MTIDTHSVRGEAMCNIFILLLSFHFALQVNLKHLEREQRRATESAIREKRSAANDPRDITKNPFNVLSFSEDNDGQQDTNGEYTSASLERPMLPDSFTICLAFKFGAWTNKYADNRILTMSKDSTDSTVTEWGYITLFVLSNYTKIDVKLGPAMLSAEIHAVVFPQQWTRFCLSLDSSFGKVARFVVDGWMLRKQPYMRKDDRERPAHLHLILGFYPDLLIEQEGEVANLNFYSNILSIDMMMDITRPGSSKCDSTFGDFLSWEDTVWTLHSKARY